MKGTVSGIMLALLLVGTLSLVFNIQPVKSEPRTWTVDDGPADFHTIQEAINAASPEDTIFVFSGIYYEHIVVNKVLSLIGENRDTTTIDGNTTGAAVYVTADSVRISGFTMRNCELDGQGVYIVSSYNNIIANRITNNYYGIDLYHCGNNSIEGNLIANNTWGVRLTSSDDNNITHNTATNNVFGFQLDCSGGNIVSENTLANNKEIGISLSGDDNTLVGNRIDNNGFAGIRMAGSSWNIIASNNIINNKFIIYIEESAENNIIYHNNFTNNQGIICAYQNNIWDDGYPSGGNYWSNYQERYPNAKEIDGSGIWDTPYVIDENNVDHYPLMNPCDQLVGDLNNDKKDVFNVRPVKTDPKTLRVPRDYSTIRAAIDAAGSGDTILVSSGIYCENIEMNDKRDLRLIGESKYTTTIDGPGIIISYSTNISVANFTIRNVPEGMSIIYSSNVTLRDINLVNTLFGVFGGEPFEAQLSDFIHDIDTSNTLDGKPIYYLVNQHDKEVLGDAGYVAVINSTGIIVRDTVLTKNYAGILFAYTSNSVVKNATAFGNYHGIFLLRSHNNTIGESTIINTRQYSIYLAFSTCNNVTKNRIESGSTGIVLWGSSDRNTISENLIVNHGCGLQIGYSEGNIIYHNTFIHNGAYVEVGESVWDNGYPSGGNYWDDCIGSDEYSGPDQDQPGSDGIGDWPYIIWPSNPPTPSVYYVDRYPLMAPTWPIEAYYAVHDMAILEVAFSKQYPSVNETICVYVTVQNKGDFAETLDISVNSTPLNDFLVGTQTTSLAPGESVTLNFTWTPTASGRYEITAYTSSIPNDIHPFNNIRTTVVYAESSITTVVYVEPPEVRFYSNSTSEHFNVTVMVKDVHNLFDFQVVIYYDASVLKMTGACIPPDHVLAGQPGVELGPVYEEYAEWGAALIGYAYLVDATPFTGSGKLATFEFEVIVSPPKNASLHSNLIISHIPPGAGAKHETALLDSEGVDIPFTGQDGIFVDPEFPSAITDVNGDEVVNIQDIFIVAKAFGTREGDKNWNPIADLDGNKEINIVDLYKVAKDFEKTV